MYLKELTIKNFRKYGSSNNTLQFAKSGTSSTDSEINIASNTTVIVGKNNSGKTTVIAALKKLLEPSQFKATDFNFGYLKSILDSYTPAKVRNHKIEIPQLEFNLKIDYNENNEGILTNMVPFISIGDPATSSADINIAVTIEDENKYVQELSELMQKKSLYREQLFYHYLELLDRTKFKVRYFGPNGEVTNDFKLKQLIELKSIAANNIVKSECLSDAFSKIVDYRYKYAENLPHSEEIEKELVKINRTVTEYFEENHTSSLNNSLSTIMESRKCKVLLRSDLNFQKLLKTVLKYEYAEESYGIPEDQFGLGYTNLMMIIASIISYIEEYKEGAFTSQINIIAIEEPETYMHPQMQEMFIRDINKAINTILLANHKEVRSQIIITTHSQHIINCKIFDGSSFNNINYVKEVNKEACVTVLSDEAVICKKGETATQEELDNFQYIKKHVTFGISNLFFADAAIFVEGISEYVLLKHYLSEREDLKHKYISLNILNGAYSHVYKQLFKLLDIPMVVITDIDFKREKEDDDKEKGKDEEKKKKEKEYLQMTKDKIGNRVTTNEALKNYFGKEHAIDIIDAGYYVDDKFMVVYQKDPVEGVFASSFEEAFILENRNKEMLHSILADIFPRLYPRIMSNGGLVAHSYHLQCSLSDKKSDFANKILYKRILGSKEALELQFPAYIEAGINFIVDKLENE